MQNGSSVFLPPHPHRQKRQGKERAQQEEITKCLKSYTLKKKKKIQFVLARVRFHSAYKLTGAGAGNSGVLSPTRSTATFINVPRLDGTVCLIKGSAFK